MWPAEIGMVTSRGLVPWQILSDSSHFLTTPVPGIREFTKSGRIYTEARFSFWDTESGGGLLGSLMPNLQREVQDHRRSIPDLQEAVYFLCFGARGYADQLPRKTILGLRDSYSNSPDNWALVLEIDGWGDTAVFKITEISLKEVPPDACLMLIRPAAD